MHFELHPDLQRDGILMGQFPLCLVILINDQTYPWFVLVPRRTDVRDTIDLSADDHAVMWAESREFSRGIKQVWGGDKLNVAALGNVTPQLHLHHIIRYRTDAAWPAPIWGRHPLNPYDATGVRQLRAKLETAQIDGLEVGQ